MAALQFVGPSMLVFALKSNKFTLQNIFTIIIFIFLPKTMIPEHTPPASDIIPTVGLLGTLFLGNPRLLHLQSCKVC